MRALTELKKFCINELDMVQHCLVCFNTTPKFLLLHHMNYYDDSVVYKQFENSDRGRIQYYAKLLDEIKIRPKNFVVLCFRCHDKLEELIRMNWNDAYTWLNDYDNNRNWNDVKFRLEILWNDCERVVRKREFITKKQNNDENNNSNGHPTRTGLNEFFCGDKP